MSPPSLVTIDASEPLEEINKIIERDGGVIVSNFLSQEVLEKAMQDGKSPAWNPGGLMLVDTRRSQSSVRQPFSVQDELNLEGRAWRGIFPRGHSTRLRMSIVSAAGTGNPN